MFERIRCIIIKEFLQIFRDPRLRAIVLAVPIIQSLVFGYAVTTDVNHVSTMVLDQDQSVASRKIIDAFVHSGYFFVTRYLDNEREIDEVMNDGETQIVIHIPVGFQGNIKGGKQSQLQVIIDGTDSNTAGIIQSYAVKIVDKQSEEIIKIRQGRKKGSGVKAPVLEIESRAWFNQNLVSKNYYVPGVIATLLTLITLTLTSMAIVREKEVGTIEQILVSPIQKYEFILGKTIPFILIGFVDVIAILLVAIFWFEVPIRGSLLLLFISVGLYLLTTLGVGFFISTISQTQQQAMMSTFMFYFPAVLLSGFIFPVANMPIVIQYATYLNPLRYFITIIRGIFLKGIGIEILWPQIVILGIMGLSTLWLATKRFQKTLA